MEATRMWVRAQWNRQRVRGSSMIGEILLDSTPFTQQHINICMKDMNQIFVWHDDVIKWKHFPRYWPFVRGIHRSPVNSPHKGQWRGALMFTLISARINGWVNNREAGDLRRYRAHYDVIVMVYGAWEITAICYSLWNWHLEFVLHCSDDECHNSLANLTNFNSLYAMAVNYYFCINPSHWDVSVTETS